jgi:hypothetical protein
MTKHEVRDDPEKIWLEPACSPERCWCEDPLDDCDEDSCGAKAIGYVREDIVYCAAFEAVNLAEDNKRLRAALQRVRQWSSPVVRGYIDGALGRQVRGSDPLVDDTVGEIRELEAQG